MAARYQYMFAPTWNVPLGSLNNVENHFGAQNADLHGIKRVVGIRSPLLDPFPIRTLLEDGSERGDGKVDTFWVLMLRKAGVKYLLDTYFASETIVKQKWTIYTPIRQRNVYARYNCWAILPAVIARDDLIDERDDLFQVTLRLLDLVASS